MIDLPFRARAFGQDWAADIPLKRFDEVSNDTADAGFEVRQLGQLGDRNVIARVGKGEICDDGFRFGWRGVATFDTTNLRQIGYFPNADWQGTMPDAFFSTVTALALAGIGLLPMHASAVEIDGRAFLFAGKAGAGKSTLTAELLAAGVRFLGDDLSVLYPPNDKHGFRVARGRPAMRLHPATASLVDASNREHVLDDARGKLLIRPQMRADDTAYPLARVFLLDAGDQRMSASEALQQLPLHLFRPRWLARMPGRGLRQALLIDLASKVPVCRFPAVAGFDRQARRARVTAALAAMTA